MGLNCIAISLEPLEMPQPFSKKPISIAVALLATFIGNAHANNDKWEPWFEAGVFSGEHDATRGEAALFMPFYQTENSLIFSELRGKLFHAGSKEGNWALGYRRMILNGWNLGVWGGYDVRTSESNNRFYQTAFGLEALHPNWDIRFNTYRPHSNAKPYPDAVEAELINNQLFVTGAAEVPLAGSDFEVGYRLPISSKQDLWVHAGAFRFDDDLLNEAVTGPKLRSEWHWNDLFQDLPGSKLALEAGFSHDDVRNERWEIGLKLTIPLGGDSVKERPLTRQERRMTAALERDTDIVAAPSGTEPVQDQITEVALNSVEFTDDDASFQQAIVNTQNSLIILDGSNGPITGGQTTGSNQTIVGGSGSVALKGSRSGGFGYYTAPGSRPQIQHTGNTPIFQVNNGNHFIAIDLTGAGQASGLTFNQGFSDRNNADQAAGTVIASPQTLAFSDLSISDTGGAGIYLGGASTLTLRADQLNLNRIGGNGIDFSGNGGLRNVDDITFDASFSNITMDDVSNSGFDFSGNLKGFKRGNLTLNFEGINLTNIATDGIRMSGSLDNFFNGSAVTYLSFKNITIDTVGEHGMNIGILDEFDNGSSDATVIFDGIRISNTGYRGIDLVGSFDEFDNATSKLKLTMNDIQLSNIGTKGWGSGIDFGAATDEFINSTLDAEITLSNISIDQVADHGINYNLLQDSSNSKVKYSLVLDNIRVTNTGTMNNAAAAIDFSGSSDDYNNSEVEYRLALSNIQIENSQDAGIDFGFSFDDLNSNTGSTSLIMENIVINNVANGPGIDFNGSFDGHTNMADGAYRTDVWLRDISINNTSQAGISLTNAGDNSDTIRNITLENVELSNTASPALDLTGMTGLNLSQ